MIGQDNFYRMYKVMSAKPEESSSLLLELGDIIKIIAPENTDLNNKSFFIQYLDNTEADLIDTTTGETTVLNITDGALGDKSIETVELISRATNPGYARQNNLLPGTWISIQLGGDVPTTINGQITSLEEDMIELSMWPGNEKIYIDFGYKGIPKNIPIEAINSFIPPQKALTDATIEKNVELARRELQELEAEEGKQREQDVSPKFPEMPSVSPVEELAFDDEVDLFEEGDDSAIDVVLDIPKKREKQLFDADEVVFGDETEELELEIDVPDDERRYSVKAQTNDLLNDLLSTIPSGERTKAVYNSLHVMIERFQQLREEFSVLGPEGDIGMPETKGADFKPIIKSLEDLNYKLHWIKPIVKNDKVIYNFELDEEDVDSGLMEMTLAQAQDGIYEVNEQYKQNAVPDGQNKYIFKYRELNPYLTPFREPRSMANVIINKETGSTMDAVVNNDMDMQSNALCGSLDLLKISRKSETSVIHLARNKFQMARYETGLTQIKPKDIKVPSLNTKLLKITPNDAMAIVGTLTLPETVMRYSQINLPETSIYTSAILNKIPFTYSKYLNNKTKYNLNVIEQDSLTDKTPMEHDNYLGQIESYIFSQSTSIEDRGNREFRAYLERIIPRTRELFDLIKKYIVNSTSYLAILQYLQPFLIFPNDISFKQYETIIRYMVEQILEMKMLLASNRKQFIEYVDYKYVHNTAFKNSYLFGLLNSQLLKKHNALAKDIQQHYGFDKATTCEFVKKILTVDNGTLFMTALSLDEIELFVALDVEGAIRNELEGSQPTAEEDAQSKEVCKNFVLAKYYLDIDDLRADDGRADVYFDDKYDETRYDIIKEFATEQASMAPDIFNNFLISHLEANVGLSSLEARKEGAAMIEGKRRVSKGDYALITNADNENTFYVRDDNNTWIHNPEMDGESISKATFCNIKKQCLSINKQCEDLVINKKKIKKQLIEDMIEQFDESVKLSNEELLQTIVDDLEYSIETISKIVKLQTLRSLQYDLIKKMIGSSLEDRVIEKSPFAPVRDLILSQEDFVDKQQNILKFINKTCRPAQILTGEDEHWFYCVESDIKLLPTFYETLAQGFFSRTYETILDQVRAQRGEISDDGDKVVDKYSGYLICRLEFDEAEGYDEAGYKIVSRAIMGQDIGDLLVDMTFKPTETIRSKDGEMIRNVIVSLSKQMGINISSEIDFIVHNVEHTLDAYLPNEAGYKASKKQGSYLDLHDEALLLLTLAYFMVVTQTMMPSVKTSKTFKGCGPRSFVGYPLEGNGNYAALKYIACVALKLRSRTRPWQRLPRLTRDKAVAILKQFMGKLKALIDKELLTKDIIHDKIKAKLAFEEGESPDANIPREFDVRNWVTFLPPLHPIKIVGLQNIGPTFQAALNNELKTGNPAQFQRMAALYGKMTLFSLQIQELIQRAVNKSVLLLENINNELLIENSCCNDGDKNTVLYFENKEKGILKTNDIVKHLEEVYQDVGSLTIPSYLFDPMNTKLQYPTVPKTFSKETIYMAFIRFCYFNSGIILDSSLQTVCGNNSSSFKNSDDIATKISILESEQRIFSLQSFLQLMNIVNRNNIINIDLRSEIYAPRAILENYLKNDEILRSLEGSSLVDFMAISDTIFDRYDVVRESDPAELETLYRYESFLDTNTDKLITMLSKFGDLGDDSVSDIFLTNLDNWKLRGENIYMSKEDETAITYVNWSKNVILNILKVFPTMILNKMDFKNPHIPTHWRSGAQKLSETHVSDIQKIIQGEFSTLSQYYNNKMAEGGVKSVLDSPEINVILDLVYMFPFFADVRLAPGEARAATILNGVIMKKVMKYLTVYSLSLYIIKTRDSLLRSDQEVGGDEAAVDITEEIMQGRNIELDNLIGNMIKSYVDIMEQQKHTINISNYQINQDVLKSKEKEKAKITKRLGDLSVDERRVEDIMKNQRLGKWGVGQTRALFVYDEDQYDKERAELEQDALQEMRIGNMDGVTERTRDIYRMEYMEEAAINDRVQNELDAEIMAQAGDDDFGERDDEGVGYSAWTGDD